MPKNIIAVFKGVLVGGLLILLFLLGAAVLLAYGPLKESMVIFLLPFIRCGCVFLGAIIAAVLNGHQGLWQGLAVGGVFLLLFTVFIMLLGLDKSVFWHIAVSTVLAGGLGGIVGIMIN